MFSTVAASDPAHHQVRDDRSALEITTPSAWFAGTG